MMNDFDSSDICYPISDIFEVLNWKCDGKCWIHKHKVVDLRDRMNYLTSGSVLDIREKNNVFSEFRWSSQALPKTIFCHDYKGGYVEDRFCNGSSNVATYRFFNWAAIDIFIYFSHKLVTIPTQGWLNAGHIHGVPVLGTVITEWEDGGSVWTSVLTDVKKINLFAEKLAEVCAHFKFDGYLLNVENEISKELVPRLIQFVALLKTNLDLYCGRRTWLIWYDSVTKEGDLDWQNKLCPLNKPFFDVCDGIFLNYVWKPSDLLESIELAGSRKFDVYVGVDVYGRNCYQDGGFNVDKAMAVLRSQNMSVALFALGWTFEKLPPGEDFMQREICFWKKFSSYLYIHGPAKLPFSTNFCQGIYFDKASGEGLFNLGMQQYQPTGEACSAAQSYDKSCISLCLDDGIKYNGACLRVAATSYAHSKIFHRVFVCDFGGMVAKSITLEVTLSLKTQDSHPASKFRIYFVLEDKICAEGMKSVDMKTRPKGYRASTQAGKLLVSGSLIDFTAEKGYEKNKISILREDDKVYVGNQSTWQEVKFLIELKAEECLTEILILPHIEGSVLWGLLQVEDFKKNEEKTQNDNNSSHFEKFPQTITVPSSSL